MNSSAVHVPEYWARAKRALARRDPVLAFIMHAHPGVSMNGRGDPFHTLARSITGQQISVKAADSVWSRICALSTIEPTAVLKHDLKALAACGLSQRKAE